MNKLFMAALMSGALCFSGTNCGAAKVQGPQTRVLKADEPPAQTVKLTNENPVSAFAVDAKELSNETEMLEVGITRVVNPSKTGVVIFVYLSSSAKGKSETEKIPIGNFSLYPADQPGKFLLNAGTALRKLAAERASDQTDIRLVLELKRLDETNPWTPVELTIAKPEWRAPPK